MKKFTDQVNFLINVGRSYKTGLENKRFEFMTKNEIDKVVELGRGLNGDTFYQSSDFLLVPCRKEPGAVFLARDDIIELGKQLRDKFYFEEKFCTK